MSEKERIKGGVRLSNILHKQHKSNTCKIQDPFLRDTKFDNVVNSRVAAADRHYFLCHNVVAFFMLTFTVTFDY